MKVYQPQVSVTLVKTSSQSTAIGMSAALSEIDITPWFGDSSSIETSKGVRQPAGTFAFTLPDKPYKGKSLYGLITPMDYVIIRMAHDSSQQSNGNYPLIMYGLVSDVTSNTSLQGGKPQRTIKITGHDFGKILQVLQIIYLPGSTTEKFAADAYRYQHIYEQDAGMKTRSAAEWVQLTLDKIINPFINKLSLVGGQRLVRHLMINGMTAKVAVGGNINTFTPTTLHDVSMHKFLTTLLDAPVFNELYTEDSEEGVTLVVREVPFKDIYTDKFVQERAYADSMDISTDDIISQSFNRTDARVANYYWVNGSHYAYYTNEQLKNTALQGNFDSFIIFGYENSDRSMYGVRLMEMGSSLQPNDYYQADNPKAEKIPAIEQSLQSWLAQRRKVLMAMNKDNVLLESGTLQLRGNEAIKAGAYLQIYDKGVRLGEVYAHTVNHQFRPFYGYLTSVQFDRGTLFFEANR